MKLIDVVVFLLAIILGVVAFALGQHFHFSVICCIVVGMGMVAAIWIGWFRLTNYLGLFILAIAVGLIGLLADSWLETGIAFIVPLISGALCRHLRLEHEASKIELHITT